MSAPCNVHGTGAIVRPDPWHYQPRHRAPAGKDRPCHSPMPT
jgi:hypothetical protein